MERLEIAIVVKVVPKTTGAELLVPSEIKEVKLPFVAKVTAPSLGSLVHFDRMVTIAMPVETKAFCSMVRFISLQKECGGEEPRPFTLKNLEALGKFLGRGKLAVTTWLTKMSC